MSSSNIYSSPLCSCIICREIKSAKGIHSHYIASHGSEDDKRRFSGKGVNRQKETSHNTQKRQAQEKRNAYLLNPNFCSCCNSALSYGSRNNKFCSHSCSATTTNKTRVENGYMVTQEHKAKTSNSVKENPSGWYKQHLNGTWSFTKDSTYIRPPYTKVYQCCICQKWFPGSRKVCNNPECRHLNLKGKIGGYRKNSTRKHRSIYNGFQMDSGAELAFVKLLDEYNIAWWKNEGQIKFKYEHPNGVNNYIPDFYLPDYDLWVEIKGKYYFNENIDPYKWKSIENLEVIWSNDIKLPAVCMGHDPILID